jgi:hypothetical protein
MVATASVVGGQPTWIELDGKVYEAKPDARGPIGGGNGYANIITQGDHTVKDLEALLYALSKSQMPVSSGITTRHSRLQPDNCFHKVQLGWSS